jgi:hypothetical protein
MRKRGSSKIIGGLLSLVLGISSLNPFAQGAEIFNKTLSVPAYNIGKRESGKGYVNVRGDLEGKKLTVKVEYLPTSKKDDYSLRETGYAIATDGKTTFEVVRRTGQYDGSFIGKPLVPTKKKWLSNFYLEERILHSLFQTYLLTKLQEYLFKI